jgi:hypothetical protein
MNRFKKYISLAIAVFWSALCHGQGTFTITFDGPPIQPTNSDYLVQFYTEDGVNFTPLPGSYGFGRNGGGWTPISPYDGTAYLDAAQGESLQFSFSDGSLFGLASVDLAGYSTVVPDFTVDFIGYRSDGSTITTSFSGSGINFQTYYFGSDWSSDLTRVEIPYPIWCMDNLVVAVPEPGEVALFGLGVFAIWSWRKSRK